LPTHSLTQTQVRDKKELTPVLLLCLTSGGCGTGTYKKVQAVYCSMPVQEGATVKSISLRGKGVSGCCAPFTQLKGLDKTWPGLDELVLNHLRSAVYKDEINNVLNNSITTPVAPKRTRGGLTWSVCCCFRCLFTASKSYAGAKRNPAARTRTSSSIVL
jgi:hypothetical protein